MATAAMEVAMAKAQLPNAVRRFGALTQASRVPAPALASSS